MIITIDGIDYDTENAQLVQAVKKLVATHDEEMKEKEKETDEEKKKTDEELEEMKKKKEKAEATADSLTSNKVSDKAISKMVSERSALLVEAKTILGDKMPDCIDCPKEIKSLVVEHVTPDMDLKDKPDAYIDAAYDFAIEQSKKAKVTNDKLSSDFVLKDKDGKEVTRDSVREDYMKKHGFQVEETV